MSRLTQVAKDALASSHASVKFDHSRRVTEFEQAEKKSNIVPGPGSYRLSSEFGQYDGDVYGRENPIRTGKKH